MARTLRKEVCQKHRLDEEDCYVLKIAIFAALLVTVRIEAPMKRGLMPILFGDGVQLDVHGSE